MRPPLRLLFTLFSIVIFITGCSSTPSQTSTNGESVTNIQKRAELLSEITSWKIKGKIAFITPEERNSASLFWDNFINGQKLNLTTYLGINVLQLHSLNNVHTIELEGEKYTDTNLNNLITSLTNLTLPTEALTHWIKAIPYLDDDDIKYSKNQLPLSLTSLYNNREWLITYSSYKPALILDQQTYVQLPYKIKVKSEDLTINIVIKNWTI